MLEGLADMFCDLRTQCVCEREWAHHLFSS
jgi:hypothetical protein